MASQVGLLLPFGWFQEFGGLWREVMLLNVGWQVIVKEEGEEAGGCWRDPLAPSTLLYFGRGGGLGRDGLLLAEEQLLELVWTRRSGREGVKCSVDDSQRAWQSGGGDLQLGDCVLAWNSGTQSR